MEAILTIRSVIKKVYTEFETAFVVIAKLLFVFLTLNLLSDNIGYYEILNITSIKFFIAVICAFLPASFAVFIVAIVALVHLFKLSIIVGAVAAIVFFIFYLIYLRFAPEQGIFILALAVLLPYNLHFAVALILAVIFSPVTIIPSALIMLVVSFIQQLKLSADAFVGDFQLEPMITAYQGVIHGVMDDRKMVITIISIAIIIIIAWVIGKMPFAHSWYIGIIAAGIAGIIVTIIGSAKLGDASGISGAVLGNILGIICASFVQFMKCVIDYKHKEKLQFEDDDYYYYVKAIPKMKSSFESNSKKKDRKTSTNITDEFGDFGEESAETQAYEENEENEEYDMTEYSDFSNNYEEFPLYDDEQQ